MRYRRGKISLFSIILIGILIVGGGWCYTFGPMYWDFYNMKQVTKDVAKDWASRGDYSKASAKRMAEALAVEMSHKNISGDITSSVCRFEVSKDTKKRDIRCDWQIQTKYPLIDKKAGRIFEIQVIIDRFGEVEQYAESFDLYAEDDQ